LPNRSRFGTNKGHPEQSEGSLNVLQMVLTFVRAILLYAQNVNVQIP
jgi:hypothetical protein